MNLDLGKGLHRPKAGRDAHRLGADLHPKIRAALAQGPVGHADLSEYLNGWVFNQGRTSGCWAHSGSLCDAGARAVAGRPLAVPPSPLYFMQSNYARLRGLEYPSGQMPALLDNGAELADAALTFAQLGSVPLQAPQQDGGTDVPATIDADGNPIPLPEMTVPEVAQGMASTFSGEYAIPVDNDAPALLMAALDAKIFVWDGFDCDQACEDLGPNDILGAPGKSLGGHSSFYWGYDLNASRSAPVDGPVFYKRGSWGKSYARNGDFTVSVAHVVASWSLFPFAVKVPS